MKIDIIGKIKSGEMADWFIIIKNDKKHTGGYLVFQSPNSKFENEGYDNWFKNLNEVKNYIDELKIEWFD